MLYCNTNPGKLFCVNVKTQIVHHLQLFGNLGKPSGLHCARKLRNRRRKNRWADKDYKKSHLGTALKANPFGGASHAKGIVLEKM